MLIEGKVGTYRHNEGVGESSSGISELIAKLDVMLIQPTTGGQQQCPRERRLGETGG